MKRGTTVFLKIAVFLIGITVLALCIFWLPWLANDTAEMFPEFAFFAISCINRFVCNCDTIFSLLCIKL